MVVAERAHVGVALDGDADRLIAVDERGDVVDGDHIIAICAADLRERGRLHDDTVVVTVMTNLGFRIAMREAGVEVVETPVGDRYVLEALAAGGYSLGGEQSGHVIFTEHATTGDGMLTALALLDTVQRSGKQLSQLAEASMTQLPQVLVNVRVGVRRSDIAELLADDIAAAAAPLGDTGRILVRPSGTEPLIRVMVEAPTAGSPARRRTPSRPACRPTPNSRDVWGGGGGVIIRQTQVQQVPTVFSSWSASAFLTYHSHLLPSGACTHVSVFSA